MHAFFRFSSAEAVTYARNKPTRKKQKERTIPGLLLQLCEGRIAGISYQKPREPAGTPFWAGDPDGERNDPTQKSGREGPLITVDSSPLETVGEVIGKVAGETTVLFH